ncbi:MAG: acyltransferase family protein [Clostridiales bacterium]|nr:acyltransferase family protein [Clostridiales bacterium]MCC8107022.1 acyltransferase family protein [Clostridiales bacterium]
MKKSNRIEWIDVAKGIGIILVIMGHCFNKSSLIHKWIFSFHMPLFFILSGYCFHVDKYQRMRDIVRAKIKSLLIPYFGFCFLGIAVSILIPEWRAGFSVKGILTDIYCAYPSLTHITSIWYLAALFILSVLLYAVVCFSRKHGVKWLPYCFVALSGCFGYLITVIRQLFFVPSDGASTTTGTAGFSLPGGRLPLTLDTCMTALVFFAAGYWIRCCFLEKRNDRNILELNLPAKRSVSLCVIFFFCNFLTGVVLNTRVNLHGCTYGNVVLFYLAAFSGTFAVVFLSQILCNTGRLKRILLFYGRNSLYIMGMQSLFIYLSVYLLNKITGDSYEVFENVPVLYGWCAFFVIAFFLIPLVCLFKEFVKTRIQGGSPE